MKESSVDVKTILAAAKKGRPSTGGHSPLYLWLWDRYADLKPELSGPGVPNWQAMADGFAQMKVYGGNGQPPAWITVRKTWWKVCRDREELQDTPKARRRRQVRSRSQAQTVEAHQAPPQDAPPTLPRAMQPPAPSPAPGEPDEEPAFQFAGTRFGKRS